MTSGLSNSNQYAHIFQQLVYLTDENESVFHIKTLEFPGLTRYVDRILLTIAILRQGGYLSEEENTTFITNNLEFGSIFHYYTSGKKFNIRNHEAFDARWYRSQSEYWSYIIT